MSSNRSSMTFRAILTPLCIGVAVAAAGCFTTKVPTEVTVTQLDTYEHAAKPPSCTMPVLDTMPLNGVRQVAIVEAWADESDTRSDVLPALQRKACETGADALVLVDSQHQNIRPELYGVNPNQERNEATSGQDTASNYINQVEHYRKVGEAGHNGFYINAVAIIYDHPQRPAQQSESNPLTGSWPSS
jgi:hypothetical protein